MSVMLLAILSVTVPLKLGKLSAAKLGELYYGKIGICACLYGIVYPSVAYSADVDEDMAFFSVDEQGVGELGAQSATARQYRLRIGPFADIDSAQTLCDKLLKVSGTSCSIVRMQ